MVAHGVPFGPPALALIVESPGAIPVTVTVCEPLPATGGVTVTAPVFELVRCTPLAADAGAMFKMAVSACEISTDLYGTTGVLFLFV